MSEIKLTIDGIEYDLTSDPNYACGYPNVYILGNWYFSKQKSKEKDIPNSFEILSFECNGYILLKNPYGTFGSDNLGGKGLLNSKNHKIHSVKRLSTNETFKIGDYFNYELREMSNPINEFLIKDEKMFIKADGVLAPMELKFISKRDKLKELFISEDGIKIFDYNWVTVYDDFSKSFVTCKGQASLNDNYKRFSNEYAADRYILKNKPKVPLFTTSIDNVVVFKGDEYYSLQKGTFHWVKCNFALDKPAEWETAATKEKLDEYLVRNKPITISYTQIMGYILNDRHSFLWNDSLLSLFKSKINQ